MGDQTRTVTPAGAGRAHQSHYWQDVGRAFVFDARGILAEYKIAGTFEAAPAARV